MTWEETILFARKAPEYEQLIKDAYLDADLKQNVERFFTSGEFVETLALIKKYSTTPSEKIKLLDLGAGNGISSIAFARNVMNVVAVEPDPSDTVGHRAIQQLISTYSLSNLELNSSYGESLPFDNNSFDVVYTRQAMHHAADLNQFVKESARILKKGGILFTSRDHVVNDEMQKKEFLSSHPFQKFYEGENAFSLQEYENAFKNAGLTVLKKLGPLDSAINYSPLTKAQLTAEFKAILSKKIHLSIPGPLFNSFIFELFKWKTKNLQAVAGRLYTFIAKKN